MELSKQLTWKKNQRNIIGLKIPTGWRQTSVYNNIVFKESNSDMLRTNQSMSHITLLIVGVLSVH